MKKVIITGAGGFIGKELTQKMIRNGVEVIAISLDFVSSFPEDPLIEKICMTLDEPEKLLEVLSPSDYDAFYHLAWQGVNGREKADPLIQTDNIKMAIKCAFVAQKLGCKKILCSGTVAERAVESLPNMNSASGGMLYGAAKHCTHILLETYCKNIGLDFVWMQFSNVYGPQNKTGNLISYTLENLLEGKEATFGPAQQPYDFIFVDDLIEAVFRLGDIKTKKDHYFIGSGEPRVLRDYLLQIGHELGKTELIKLGVRPDDGIRYSLDMFDITDLQNEIGVYNKTDFDVGVKATIAGYGDVTIESKRA